MKFVLLALVGTISAAKWHNDGCAPKPAPTCQAAAPVAQEYTCDQAALPVPSLRGALDAGARLPQPGMGGCNGYAVLSGESASSKTCIGAQQVAIPDKHLVTDQAKVNEGVNKGQKKSQTCQVAQRKFSIAGEVTVTEKYNDSMKGENTSETCGQGASQTRSRTQMLCGSAKAKIPVTTQCAEVPSAPCMCNQA